MIGSIPFLDSLNIVGPHPGIIGLLHHIVIFSWVRGVLLHQHVLECFHVLQQHIPVLLKSSVFINSPDVPRFVDNRRELLLSVWETHQLCREH